MCAPHNFGRNPDLVDLNNINALIVTILRRLTAARNAFNLVVWSSFYVFSCRRFVVEFGNKRRSQRLCHDKLTVSSAGTSRNTIIKSRVLNDRPKTMPKLKELSIDNTISDEGKERLAKMVRIIELDAHIGYFESMRTSDMHWPGSAYADYILSRNRAR